MNPRDFSNAEKDLIDQQHLHIIRHTQHPHLESGQRNASSTFAQEYTKPLVGITRIKIVYDQPRFLPLKASYGLARVLTTFVANFHQNIQEPQVRDGDYQCLSREFPSRNLTNIHVRCTSLYRVLRKIGLNACELTIHKIQLLALVFNVKDSTKNHDPVNYPVFIPNTSFTVADTQCFPVYLSPPPTLMQRHLIEKMLHNEIVSTVAGGYHQRLVC